ncbi:MAG: O-antigen ligase family protein [Massilia sp.]
MNQLNSFSTTRLERVVQQFFLLALFSVSFSTALTNVFVGLSYIGFVIAIGTNRALRGHLRAAPGLFALALLAMYILGTQWSIGPVSDQLVALKKYSRLLLMPIGIALSWRDPTLPRRALYYFLGGAGVLALSNYLTRFELMPTSSLGWWRVGDAKDSFVFRNHITIGILLAFASMASFLLASYAATTRKRVLAAAAGLAFMIPVVFLNQGRTGYVALLIGLVTLFLLRVRITPLRTVAGIAGIVLLFAGFYAGSDNMRSRSKDLVYEVTTNQQHSPNGVRKSFMEVGLRTVREHPLIGIGTGSFSEAYAPTAAAVWGAGTPMALARHQPHSEFLITTVQLGLAGLLLYLGLIGSIGRAALGKRSFERDLLALLWMIYVSTSIFNSLLWDTTEAHWFLLLSSCLYVAAWRQRAPSPVAVPAGVRA